MLQRSPFAQQVLFRFERYVRKHGKGVILISTGTKDHLNIDQFSESIMNSTIVVSPAIFDVEGIKGNLHSSFLMIENFPIMQAFSGSFVEYDSELGKCQRIYLDLFVGHEEDMDDLLLEMEQVLNEKLKKIKKKTVLS